jgi:hypothetical protein
MQVDPQRRQATARIERTDAHLYSINAERLAISRLRQ